MMESLPVGPVPKKRKCSFQPEWLRFPEFKNWLRRVKEGPNAPNMASCALCNKNFSIASGGVRDVRSHSSSRHHCAVAQELKGNATLTSFVRQPLEKEVKRAEMMMANLIAQHNLPLSLADDLSVLFSKMFTDSTIAKPAHQD